MQPRGHPPATADLDTDREEVLREMARIDGIPVSDEIREAIAAHIDRRRKDAAFQGRLRASLERRREIGWMSRVRAPSPAPLE
jgi:hypothetical protein